MRHLGRVTLIGLMLLTAATCGSDEGDATLTADFQADTVTGDGGCNIVDGPYTAGKGDISIGPLA